jgi:hypothetical protein
MAPGDGWKQRVLAQVDALEATEAKANEPAPAPAPVTPLPARPRPWRRWAAAGAVVAAAAAAIAIYLGTRPGAPRFGEQLAVAAEVRDGAAKVRGQGAPAKIGDTLVARGESPGPGELRVYGDTGELVAACSDRGGPGCAVERDGDRRRFVLEVPLRARGQVHVVVFGGAQIPASRETLAADIEAAKQAGGTVIPKPPIAVE